MVLPDFCPIVKLSTFKFELFLVLFDVHLPHSSALVENKWGHIRIKLTFLGLKSDPTMKINSKGSDHSE